MPARWRSYNVIASGEAAKQSRQFAVPLPDKIALLRSQ
jgi:hypothetical protein